MAPKPIINSKQFGRLMGLIESARRIAGLEIQRGVIGPLLFLLLPVALPNRRL
jgi:hypothetical protein